MPFVLDASVAAAWALADESSPVADEAAILLRTDTSIAPRIWWYEIRNLLVVNERRKRITPPDTAAFLRALASVPIEIEHSFEESAIFQLARDHQLSFYDAAYIELALRRSLPLATLDKRLQLAAAAAGVPPLA